MTTHIGVANLDVEPRHRTEVTVELLGGKVIIKDSKGDTLASWKASEVRAEYEEEWRLLLKAGDERIFFETPDPAGFISSLAAEHRRLHDDVPSDPTKQAARMGAVRYRESTEEPESKGPLNSGENLGSAEAPVSYWVVPPRVDTSPGGPEEQQDGPLGRVESGKQIERRSPRELLESVQPAVVDSLHSGMKAWFGFYFVTSKGTGQERLSGAITGLREAANRLHGLADQLSDVNNHGAAQTERLGTYRDAVDEWARGLGMLAEGVELDNQNAAQKGLTLLVEAAMTAKRVVRGPVYPNLVRIKKGAGRVYLVGEALDYLFALSPPRRVSKTAMRHAKQPWEQAIIAAGSPFRRL